MAGNLVTADAQVQAYGEIKSAKSLADFAGLKLTTDEAKTLAGARPGDAVNLSAGEIAAFKAIPEASSDVVIEGKSTYVLMHVLSTPSEAARVLVWRRYYASTGFNGGQSVAGLFPVQGGTVVMYESHVFTDQVTGFGGSMKRNIGSSVMAGRMKEIFEAARKKVDQ